MGRAKRTDLIGGADLPTPHKGVRTVPETGAFAADGGDPQMLWRPSPEQQLQLKGSPAVRVTTTLVAIEGTLIDPCVYVDWGDGFSEDTQIPLLLTEGGAYTALAQSNAGSLRRIRLDPSIAPCTFTLTAFEVEPTATFLRDVPRLSYARRLGRRILRRAPAPIQRRLREIYRFAVGGADHRRAVIGKAANRAFGGSSPWRKAYSQSFDIARHLRSPAFAAPPLAPPRRDPEGATMVAFYLPQYHPIPQNDAWWGPGFTEWTNVAKAVPQFTGHLQPRRPKDFGYYDLRVPDVQRAQADLAARTGVDAFMFHYYWFAGQRLLEKPLDAFVNDPEITLPFALSWANENWTRRWDGAESDVLIGQRHSPEDDIAVFDDIARYIASPRYLRVAGKPLLAVYRPDALPDAAATVARWRARARDLGIGELFILCTNAFGYAPYAQNGFDGLVEFPPHAISIGEITEQVERLNPGFKGRVYDYPAVAARKIAELSARTDPRYFPGVMPAWDNEARKPGAGHVFHNADPLIFSDWTAAAIQTTRRLAPAGERLVFVNAWNEWAEGAYLEPDAWFGHAFAHSVRSAIKAAAPRIDPADPVVARSLETPARHDAVVLLHLHYPELIAEFAALLSPIADRTDVVVTFSDHWSPEEVEALAAALPLAKLMSTPNAGRDVAPFIHALTALDPRHKVFLKLHSKRSPHTHDGDAWRKRLAGPLTAPEAVEAVLARFAANPRLGLIATEDARMRLGEHAVLMNNRALLDALARRLSFTYDDDTPFVAGTMFWGRTEAFAPLVRVLDTDLVFEKELGRIDGTLAHAFERAFVAIVQAGGFAADWSL